jgi:putative inorganic carbon (HCO3(-)) transporter
MDVSTLGEEAQRLESVGILANSNDIASIFVLAIPFCLFMILKSRLRPFSWIVGLAAMTIMSSLIWDSQSRGALLALFCVFAGWLFLNIKNKRLIALAMVLGLAGTIGTFKLMTRGAADLEGSTSNRIIFWKAGANMAIRNPVFGVGYWGFNRNFSSYAIDGDLGTEGKNMTAHSSWVLAMAEGGFIALGLFVSLWLYAMFLAWKQRKEDPEYFMALSGYGMAMSFLSHTYMLYPYILLAIVITHHFVAQDEKEQDTEMILEKLEVAA